MKLTDKIKTVKIKTLMGGFLVILAVAGIRELGVKQTLPQLVIAVISAGFLDFGILFVKKRNLIFPSSAIISGLIISLVLKPGTQPAVAVFAASVAILSKHIIKLDNRHIFNPANFGLLVTVLIFNTYLSWWGGVSTWPVVAMGLLIGIRYRRLHLLFSFFITGITVMGIHSLVRGIPLKNSLFMLNYFFLFVMVVEPKTSPVKKGGRIIYGVLAALFSTGFLVFDRAGGNYWVAGLAGANILVPAINRLTLPKSTAGRVEDTKRNVKICAEYCGSCPSFPDDGGGILYCARGKSSVDAGSIGKKGCMCPDCEVQKDSGSTGTYYCIYKKSK
ncbi:MAG: RnfABCDGE type electron transport complex subunit D [Elusimicrobiota bacterium]